MVSGHWIQRILPTATEVNSNVNIPNWIEQRCRRLLMAFEKMCEQSVFEDKGRTVSGPGKNNPLISDSKWEV